MHMHGAFMLILLCTSRYLGPDCALACLLTYIEIKHNVWMQKFNIMYYACKRRIVLTIWVRIISTRILCTLCVQLSMHVDTYCLDTICNNIYCAPRFVQFHDCVYVC
jgi:hypothetical protein